jgi:hypothetical protein
MRGLDRSPTETSFTPEVTCDIETPRHRRNVSRSPNPTSPTRGAVSTLATTSLSSAGPTRRSTCGARCAGPWGELEAVGYTGAVAVALAAAGRHDGTMAATKTVEGVTGQVRLGGKGDAVGARLRLSIRGLDFGGEPVEIGDVRFVGPELDITE